MRRGLKLFTRLLIVSLVAISLFGCNKKEETVAITEVDTQESYRVITISTIEGSAYVKHSDGQIISAYEGMNLYDGDTVTVGENSNIIVDADSDKHMLAEAGTRFWLTAEGTEEHNNTKINLEKGSVLCQITEKLEDGESFDVVTASSTMCVRGTVFRVNTLESDNNTYDVVEVYNGKVWSSINDTDEEVTLDPGKCAIVQTSNETSESSFIKADQIDRDEWNSGNYDESINNEDGEDTAALDIDYLNLSLKAAKQLLEISDGDQELSISKEDLEAIIDGTYGKVEVKIEAKPIVEAPIESDEEDEEPVYAALTESGYVAGKEPDLTHPGQDVDDATVLIPAGDGTYGKDDFAAELEEAIRKYYEEHPEEFENQEE